MIPIENEHSLNHAFYLTVIYRKEDECQTSEDFYKEGNNNEQYFQKSDLENNGSAKILNV